MAEIVMATILLLLASYGFVQGVRRVVLWLMCPAGWRCGVWMVFLKGHREDAECLVRRLAVCRRWNILPAEEVCVVDVGADAESARLARCAANAVGVVRFIPFESQNDFFAEISQKTEKTGLQEDRELV